MTNVEIINLKPEYQKMVMNNQQKYNPDFNGELNDAEISVLMAETGVKSVKELMPVNEKDDLSRRIANGIHVKKVVTDSQLNGSYEGGGVGVGTGGVGVGAEGGTIQGDISRTIEIDFYEGQRISDVKESIFKDCFRDLDLNRDGQLSANEIESYKNYLKLRDTNEKLHSDLKLCNDTIKGPKQIGAALSWLGGIAGAALTGVGLKGLLNLSKYHFYWSKEAKGLAFDKPIYEKMHDLLTKDLAYESLPSLNSGFSKTTILCGALVGTCLCGFGIYKAITKRNAKSIEEAKKRKPQLEIDIKGSDTEVNRLKKRYTHIDA